jgi:hypothetical protein
MYSLLSLHAMQAYKSEGTDPLITLALDRGY